MAHLKVLSPSSSPLSDLLGPLPTEEDVQMPTLEDPTEALTRAVLRGRVEEEVRAASQNNMVLPPTLLDQVADHVLYLAKDEPCGLRGCVLTVLWADVEEEEQQLAQVKADALTPTTHHLVLTLRPDPASWYTKMARIFRSLGKRRMVVSPQYDLIKRRLYNFED
ncbi:DNA damage-inducible transcript 4-like protein [Penaeus japonicus]|uniref:DNA damage-inducible transcript 4-like protein n=1 Tax=Penaeus japonicus TaxID=27405 RepID=UPI001C70B560|nr:DNA damage-inducible transcript 4-like protein [Penaeus japonicus]